MATWYSLRRTVSSTVITQHFIAQIFDHRLDSLCRTSLPKPASFSSSKKKKSGGNTPRKHHLSFALLECSRRRGTCCWLQQRQTAWLGRVLSWSGTAILHILTLCYVPQCIQASSWKVSNSRAREVLGELSARTMVGRYFAVFKMLLREPRHYMLR